MHSYGFIIPGRYLLIWFAAAEAKDEQMAV